VNAPAAPAAERLDRRRIYIVPTRAGFTLGTMVIVILLGAINYDNALGYLLAFLLGGLTLVAMLHTWRNLAGLAVSGAEAMPVFAGERARFACRLVNDAPRPRLALSLGHWPRGLKRAERRYHAQQATSADLPPACVSAVEVARDAPQRGWLALGRLRIESRYPLGIFVTWAYFEPPATCLVYPAPRGHLPLPRQDSRASGSLRADTSGSDDYAGLRAYAAGDPVRAIAWKTLARAQPLMIKRFHGSAAARISLEWFATAALGGDEARLSQLTAWVLEADRAGLAFSLALPDTRFEHGRGRAHRDACLRALALFGL